MLIKRIFKRIIAVIREEIGWAKIRVEFRTRRGCPR